jgi:hypothetical protein
MRGAEERNAGLEGQGAAFDFLGLHSVCIY